MVGTLPACHPEQSTGSAFPRRARCHSRCFAEFTLSSFAALRTVRSGRANGLSMTAGKRLPVTCLRNAVLSPAVRLIVQHAAFGQLGLQALDGILIESRDGLSRIPAGPPHDRARGLVGSKAAVACEDGLEVGHLPLKLPPLVVVCCGTGLNQRFHEERSQLRDG